MTNQSTLTNQEKQARLDVNQLKQLGLATHNFESTNTKFPDGIGP